MNTTAIGRAAEATAATHLVARGFRIIAQNWRNRWCELDIVADRQGVRHFIEVKYRRSTAYGSPTEYISYDKLTRLERAARAHNQSHRYARAYQIDVIAVTGPAGAETVEHIENITS